MYNVNAEFLTAANPVELDIGLEDVINTFIVINVICV